VKTFTRANPHAKAVRLQAAGDVQFAAKGLGNRDHRVHPDPVIGRVRQNAARRQFERTLVAGTHPQVAVPILPQGPDSPTGQPVILGPQAGGASVRGKLSQNSIQSHPDVAFARFEDVEDAGSRRSADVTGEFFEPIRARMRSRNRAVKSVSPVHPYTPASVCVEVRHLNLRDFPV
jgi:hypothetical protein